LRAGKLVKWRKVTKEIEMNPLLTFLVDSAACVVDLKEDERWATSGDWGQTKRFGYFHILDPRTGMLLQCGNNAPALVAVRGMSSAVCDGVATAAMVFETAAQSHAWLHSVKSQFQLSHFYVVSRGARSLLTQDQAPTESLLTGNGLSSFASMLGQPECLLEWGQGQTMPTSTLRIVSLSPLLVSALVPRSFNASQFTVKGKSCFSCSLLHCEGGLLVASCSGDLKATDLRRQFATTAIVSIHTPRGGVLDKCTSVAVLESGLVSFNVEKKSLFGELLIGLEKAALLLKFVVGSAETYCKMMGVSAAGDHLLVLCKSK
jgi:hypothetical protein